MVVKVLGWILGVPFAIILVIFAISNRTSVRLDLWPLPFGIETPLYLLVLGPLAMGFLAGAVVVWLVRRRRGVGQKPTL